MPSNFEMLEKELEALQFDTSNAKRLLGKLEANTIEAPFLSLTEDGFCIEWTNNERITRDAQVYVTFWSDFVLTIAPGKNYQKSLPNTIDLDWSDLIDLLESQ